MLRCAGCPGCLLGRHPGHQGKNPGKTLVPASPQVPKDAPDLHQQLLGSPARDPCWRSLEQPGQQMGWQHPRRGNKGLVDDQRGTQGGRAIPPAGPCWTPRRARPTPSCGASALWARGPGRPRRGLLPCVLCCRRCHQRGNPGLHPAAGRCRPAGSPEAAASAAGCDGT